MIYDSHCHLRSDAVKDAGQICSKLDKIDKVVVLSSNETDYLGILELCGRSGDEFGDKFGDKVGDKIVCGFGIHPWFSHLFHFGDGPVDKKEHYRNVLAIGAQEDQADVDRFIDSLPAPLSFNAHWNKLLAIVTSNSASQKFVLGEIGIDKNYKVSRKYRVKMDHQVEVFSRQFDIGIAHLPVMSIHLVKGDEVLLGYLKRLERTPPLNISLHSYCGSAESLRNITRHCNKLRISCFVGISKRNESRYSEYLEVVGQQDLLLFETDEFIDTEDYLAEVLDKRREKLCGSLDRFLSY